LRNAGFSGLLVFCAIYKVFLVQQSLVHFKPALTQGCITLTAMLSEPVIPIP
jgi:hypothetical protein